MTKSINNEQELIFTLRSLAHYLPDDLLFQAFKVARKIRNEWSRADALGDLAQYMDQTLLYKLMLEIRLLPKGSGVISCLKHLSVQWTEVCKVGNVSEFDELSSTLRSFSVSERGVALGLIDTLTPVILKQSGEDAFGESLQAIRDTAQWWP